MLPFLTCILQSQTSVMEVMNDGLNENMIDLYLTYIAHSIVHIYGKCDGKKV